MKKLKKEGKELDMDMTFKDTEEKEEYLPYAWNKKKKKYVPVGKSQPSLNLCKEYLSTLSQFLNPLIFDEHRTKICKRKIYVQVSYTKWEEVQN